MHIISITVIKFVIIVVIMIVIAVVPDLSSLSSLHHHYRRRHHHHNHHHHPCACVGETQAGGAAWAEGPGVRAGLIPLVPVQRPPTRAETDAWLAAEGATRGPRSGVAAPGGFVMDPNTGQLMPIGTGGASQVRPTEFPCLTYGCGKP
jgi:hypothetical protein